MQKVDVVCLYEKAVRELDVACAVKYLAQRLYGLRVEIVQQDYGWRQAVSKFRPRVVILPFCYQERSHHMYLVAWRKSIFFNLTWEQLFYPGNRTAKTPRGNFAVNHVMHHSWSDSYADFLRQQGIPDRNIFVNGNLAYALYDEPYRRYFKQRSELASQYGLDPAKKWVFFPENYNWAFYDEAMLEQMIADGQEPDQVYAMRDFSRRSFEAAVGWCKTLASVDDVELIVRPRPATAPEDFVSRVKEVIQTVPERMRITKQETVREWILASDLVISSYSTSLIETALAGKAAFMLEPYHLPTSLRQDWHSLLPHISSQEELLDVALNGAGRDSSKRLGEWARSAMLSRGDPIRNVVDYLARICRGDIQPPAVPSRASVTPPGRLPFPALMIYEYRNMRVWITLHRPTLRPRPPMQVRPESEHDVAGLEEIPARLARWERVLADYLSN